MNEANSLSDDATFAGKASARPQRSDVSLGDERTLGGGDAAGLDTVIDDIEVVDLEARYKIEGTLGQGGMGAVLLATDTRLGRKVAIKRILGEAAGNRMAVQRFLTEAKAIAALNHPNIVQIYDYGRAKDGPFLIMEYVDGGSVADRCKQAALPLDETVSLACQICDGLAKAHDAGIVHRDIKPANVLLNRDGHPKLTDFGLAKAEAHDHGMTMTGAVMGTPDFMPPEQRRDAAEVDHRSDLWSLAATVYQMVTGRNPKIIRFDLLPGELTKVLGKALEEEKDARYQSAREFRDSLSAAVTGPSKPTSPVTAETVERALQEGQCKACGTVTSDLTKKFCRNPQCGASLRVACLKCEAQMPVWDGVCGECGGTQARLALEIEHVAEARKHLIAFDYPSAIHSLESLPESSLGAATLSMLDEVRSRHAESQKLLADIAAKIKQKEIDGLLPVVERAMELRGDRKDLKKIRGQLVERREHRLARVQAAMDAGDARAAVAALEGAAEKDFGQQAAMIEHVRKTAAIETRLAGVLKEAKADGVVTPVEAQSVLTLCEAYLQLNPQGVKIKDLADQCRVIVRPPLILNSVGIELKLIEPGTFTMGDAQCGPDSTPHRVTLTKPFYLGVYEVTNAQWKRVMGNVPSRWNDDDRPVEQVSWEDAMEFCKKLSAIPAERRSGRLYRLPTEAEWEYACRAGGNATFSFGADESLLGEYAWFEANSGKQTQPVGQKKPNAWGLYDMHGNVLEWCSDWYGYYSGVAVTDPQGASGAAGLSMAEMLANAHANKPAYGRVDRGGSWYDTAGRCRSAFRTGTNPSSRHCSTGFRLALSPSGVK